MESLQENEEQKIYEEIIKEYLLKNNNNKKYSINNINEVNMKFKKLGGGMNKNFLVEITTTTTNNNNNSSNLPSSFFLFFRYFGNTVSECLDKKMKLKL